MQTTLSDGRKQKYSLSDRFWGKVKIGKSDECWIWLASKDSTGHGRFSVKQPNGTNIPVLAYRLAWELTNGKISADLHVFHKCDNPSCVNPDHLFLAVPSTGKKITSISDRFWEKVNIRGKDECWIWLSAKDINGYGRFYAGKFNGKRKYILAHRQSYELTYGDIKDNLHVCHTCDTPSCVNPSHMFLGVAADNIKDMVSKNRQARNENHSQAKLTNVEVTEIRKLWGTGHYLQREIAEKFGVGRQEIGNIVNKKNWIDIND